MTTTINHVAVLGAGTMGAGIAAHCANAGLRVTLLDLSAEAVRAGFERMQKARPAALFTPATANLITPGTFTDDLPRVAEADWIVEAIVERLELKRELMARLDGLRRPDAVVSSNTSGIPLHLIADGLSDAFRRHFLGTHFFNPPRYMKLLELIPTADTEPATVERMRRFGERVLGKGVVICKDTPNFIANRIGSFDGMAGMRYAIDHGYTVEEVDALTGPLVGAPNTASFRLADLAGLDIAAGVANNLYAAVPDDESRDAFRPPELLARLVREGRLGNKTGAGFYRQVSGPKGQREFHVLDFQTLEYRPPRAVDLPVIEQAGKIVDLGERLRFILRQADAGDRGARLIEHTLLPTLAYAARRIPEISDDLVAVDNAIRWGFARQLGPFETWDALGVADTVERMERQGIVVAAWVKRMLADGNDRFYRRDGDSTLVVYDPINRAYVAVRRDPEQIDLRDLKAAGAELVSTPGASLIDLGDGVLCLELHSPKANAIGADAFTVLDAALERLEQEDTWRAMVIGNQGPLFSAGVDLREVGRLVESSGPGGMAEFLAAAHARLQRLRFCPKPVVAAAFGQTLGLGLEVALACAAVCAEAETYMGLVEVGVGLIPGGGGCKELVRRVVSPPMRTPGADPMPFVRQVFETIGQAKVSSSAAEARELGFLLPTDRVVLGRDRLLCEAKRLALGLAEAGYRPPLAGATCYAAGRGALATLRIGVHQMKVGGFISDYDAHLADALARVLCGGDLSAPQWVTEDYLLGLERTAFMALLAEPNTRARIRHLLDTGKPLRN